MEMPPELGLLAEMLDSEKLHPLRQRILHRRYLKTQLERFTDRIFFFPVGIQPNLDAPIQVFQEQYYPLPSLLYPNRVFLHICSHLNSGIYYKYHQVFLHRIPNLSLAGQPAG